MTVKYVRRFLDQNVITKKVVPAGGDRHRAPDENPLAWREQIRRKKSNSVGKGHQNSTIERNLVPRRDIRP